MKFKLVENFSPVFNSIEDLKKWVKKRQKGLSPFHNPDAGNVEYNNAVFNHAMGNTSTVDFGEAAANTSESPSTNPTGPMAEAKEMKYYNPRNYEIKAETMLEDEYGEDTPVELVKKHKWYLDFEPQYILKYKVWPDEKDPDKVIYAIVITGTKKLHEFETESEADAYWDKFFEDDDLYESVNSEYALIKHYYDPRIDSKKFIYKVVEIIDETELGGIDYRVKGSAERGFASKSNIVKKFNTKAEADEYIKTLHEDVKDVDLYTLDALSYYFGKLVTEEDISDYTADEIERAEDYYSLKDFRPSERIKIFATKWKNNKKIADKMSIVENTSKITKHPISEDTSDTDKLTTYYQIWAKGPSDSKYHFQDEYAYLNDLIDEAKGYMSGDADVRVIEVEEDESGNIVKRNGEVLFYSDSAIQTIDKELFDVATPQETADMFGKKVYSKKENKLYIPTGPVFEAAKLSPEEKLERERKTW